MWPAEYAPGQHYPSDELGKCPIRDTGGPDKPALSVAVYRQQVDLAAMDGDQVLVGVEKHVHDIREHAGSPLLKPDHRQHRRRALYPREQPHAVANRHSGTAQPRIAPGDNGDKTGSHLFAGAARTAECHNHCG